MNRLTYEAIIAAFVALDVELVRLGTDCQLAVVGGAALVLKYRARDSTKDVDAVALPEDRKAAVAKAARTVAEGIGLPADWLNDGAKGFMQGLELTEPVWEGKALVVRTASDDQLLAMKLCAWRDDIDIGDARLLLSKLSGSREEIWGRLRCFLIPGRDLRAQYALEDLWEADREGE